MQRIENIEEEMLFRGDKLLDKCDKLVRLALMWKGFIFELTFMLKNNLKSIFFGVLTI